MELRDLALTKAMAKASSGGTDTSDATATASDIRDGKTAYANGEKVTGTIPTVTQATPSISVSTAGKITASATQSAGYVSAGTKSATKQLTTLRAQTITPGTSDKTITSGRYLIGPQTIKGDANLVAENIKLGVSIFGVSGTYAGGGSSGGSAIDQVMQMDGYVNILNTEHTEAELAMIQEATDALVQIAQSHDFEYQGVCTAYFRANDFSIRFVFQ